MTQPHSAVRARILLLVTGGTISSRRGPEGAALATDQADTLLDGMRDSAVADHIADVVVEARDVMLVGSYLMTPADMIEVVRAIGRGLARDDIDGIVVSHGTDTMEETAFLADLFHSDPRPVVFTGAQRSADVSDTDGPRNLVDAITIASSRAARGLGVLISFGGRAFAAYGTRKAHTLDLAAFASDAGGIGHIWGRLFTLHAIPRRVEPLELSEVTAPDVRVDIVPYYPGADVTALRAVARAGAEGIVLEGTGAGNLNPAFCAEIADLTARGVPVALTTRVAYGPVMPIYGAGGGVDAVAAGAIPTGTLRASQARMLLVALLASGHPLGKVREEMRRRGTQDVLRPQDGAHRDRITQETRG